MPAASCHAGSQPSHQTVLGVTCGRNLLAEGLLRGWHLPGGWHADVMLVCLFRSSRPASHRLRTLRRILTRPSRQRAPCCGHSELDAVKQLNNIAAGTANCGVVSRPKQM